MALKFYFFTCFLGKWILNKVFFDSDSSVSSPPWFSIIAWAIPKPIPVPSPIPLVVKKGLKMSSRISFGTPFPLSANKIDLT